jgi:hypothetical protein
MKSFIKNIALVSVLATFLFSCSDNETTPDPTASLVKITEGVVTDAQAKVEVWGESALVAGYNPLYIRLRRADNDAIIDDAHISLSPMMYMTSGMNHACPVENPEGDAVNGLFPAGIFFVMPTSDMGYWELTIHVHNHINGNEGEITLDIDVANPDPTKMRSFTTASGEKYFLSYYFPQQPKVGINDWVVVAYKRVSGMSWPAAENLSFVLTPEMPSMGHGSPNNVNPAHTTGARYAGKVNFTMTGLWRLNLRVQVPGEEPFETYFDVTLD